MSIDYNKNSYTKVGNYTNVVNELDKLKDEKLGQHIIQNDFEPLIQKLALRHPEWTFVGMESMFGNHSNAYIIRNFRVYEGAEQLGQIWLNTWRETKFEIRNPRIARSMSKRNYKSTKDVDKAIKIVESEFQTKTPPEAVVEAMSKASAAASDAVWRARREFDNLWGKLTPIVLAYIIPNMDAIRPILEALGATPTQLDALVPMNEKVKAARDVAESRSNENGTLVVLYGDRYIVRTKDNTEILTASQLSEDVRTKLGVLKLVEDDAVIASFGHRVSSTIFYLLP